MVLAALSRAANHGRPRLARMASVVAEASLANGGGMPMFAVVADGTRPYTGRVRGWRDRGVYVDIGAEQHGWLPCDEATRPRSGSKLTVYCLERSRKRNGEDSFILSLVPDAVPRVRMSDLKIDGTVAVQGKIRRFVHQPRRCAVVDIGCDVGGWLSEEELVKLEQRCGTLAERQTVTAYPIRSNKKRLMIELAADPVMLARTAWESLVADGQTSYIGRVFSFTPHGALIDIDANCFGLLRPDEAGYSGLQPGQPVTVYIKSRLRHNNHIQLTMVRASRPRERLEAIVADGSTPYAARVMNFASFGVFMDINAEVHALLPYSCWWDPEEEKLASTLTEGQEVTVYVMGKKLDTGKLSVSLRPHPQPIVPLAAVKTDGVTKYNGVITSVTETGAWLHIGADTEALLRCALETPVMYEISKTEFDARGYEIGQKMDVYLMRKNMAKSKLEAWTEPAPQRRLSLSEVQKDMNKVFRGTIYHVSYGEAIVDIGCEASGLLSRSEVPDAERGSDVYVVPTTYDASIGRLLVRRATADEVSAFDSSRAAGSDPVEFYANSISPEGSGFTFHRRSTGEQVQHLPDVGWVEVRTPDGPPYYWNLATGETTWEQPS